MSLPLEGVRVLDLSRILAGPYCTMVLADLGAEVLKVEPPGGDDARRWGPPFVAGESTYFLSVNRGKKSLVLDLKSPAGADVLRRLVRISDVLVENFRPGTLERLGFGYEAVRALRPELVYCSISGYGQTGALRERPGYDAVMQGEGGWMDLTGQPDGPPTKLGASLADIVTGMMAAQGILAALVRRAREGAGARVDVALFDSVVATLCYQAQSYLSAGIVPRRMGNRHPSLCPYETFRTADGTLILAVGNDALWRRFCRAVGREELAAEPRFATNAKRVENREALSAILDALFAAAPTEHWLSRLEAEGVPAGRVRTVAEVFASPQIGPRAMLVETEHPRVGPLRLVGNPIKIDGAHGREAAPPPVLGEHTEAVLRDRLGLDAAAVAALRARGAFGPARREEG